MSDHTFDVYLDVKNKNDPSINFGNITDRQILQFS